VAPVSAIVERTPTLRPSEAINLAGVDTGREHLSHTRASLWLACHRKFELHYLKRLELVTRPRQFTLGSAFQKGIEFQDPEVGVRYLNGFEPCPMCKMDGWVNESGGPEPVTPTTLGTIPCPTCEGRIFVGEQLHFWSQEAENEHRVNEAIVRAAAALYLRRWPAGAGERREFEFKVQLRSPWTGAYSRTFDLLGYADGLVDRQRSPDDRLQHRPAGDHREQARRPDQRRQSPTPPLGPAARLERYGIWRATGRTVQRVHYRWVKKPSIKQRKGRELKDGSIKGAETLDEFCERIAADYEERPDFYLHEEAPQFTTTDDLLRIEADLWEWAEDIRARMRRASDGRRRVFDRNTSHCSEYAGCQFLAICTGDPDAMSLYQVRPKRSERGDAVPEAEAA
jgi:hypothetical protein